MTLNKDEHQPIFNPMFADLLFERLVLIGIYVVVFFYFGPAEMMHIQAVFLRESGMLFHGPLTS